MARHPRHAARALRRPLQRSVQQTIYNIATAILEALPARCWRCRSTLPNKHHNLVDLVAFGLENPGEVFIATQDPFGLITGR